MSQVTPVLNSNFYGFDYYEVAYTCLATQYPVLGNLVFPNITFANASYISTIQSTPVNGSPIFQNVDQLFTTSTSTKDFIVINDIRANNVVADNIGVQFYTEAWEDALGVCKEINTTHTWAVDIGGNYANADQRQEARKLLWDKWWKTLLYMQVDLSDFFLLGVEHTLDMNSATYALSASLPQFQNWLTAQNVCSDTQTALLNLYGNLPTTIQSEFGSILDANTILTPNGVYLLIEQIDANSTINDCYSPYRCLNNATAEEFTNLSDGTEDETCVTYWLATTPATSSLSEGYTYLTGPCATGVADMGDMGSWTKYRSVTLRRPRLDFISITGKLIVPTSTVITRSGSIVINASDIFNNCSDNYEISISYGSFIQSFETPYGACCTVVNGVQQNWTMNTTVNSPPYNITVTPLNMSDSSGTLLLTIPQAFFNNIRANPALLTQQFTLQWQLNLVVSGACLGNAIVDNYINIFYPYCKTGQLYYQDGCGIVFNEAEGFSNGVSLNALTTLDTIKTTIRQLFTNYNCYAQQLSQTELYGDVIKVTGRLYDEHGSECYFLLKQVLRPILNSNNIVINEGLKGFTLPNTTFTPPQVQTNSILPQVPPTSTKLSGLFTKNGNKLCPVLPPNLTYN